MLKSIQRYGLYYGQVGKHLLGSDAFQETDYWDFDSSNQMELSNYGGF
jgi:hypothetical protein